MERISDLTIAPCGPEHAEGLAEFFERAAVPCHCRYFHFTGDSNAWLSRSVHAPELNRAEMLGALAARSDEMMGMVALFQGRVAGFLKLSPSASVPKLYGQRLYRGLSCFSGTRDGYFAIGCVLVLPELRRRGIAQALVRGAVDAARALGARAIEAFPRRGTAMRDDELWTGPYDVFAKNGFATVHDFAPYPVLRLTL